MKRDAITITPVPEWGIGQARVEVNGHDISRAVRGADIRLRAGDIPAVDLELAVFEVRRLDLPEAEILIDSDVHDALIALGWTPPPDAGLPPVETPKSPQVSAPRPEETS